MDNKLLQVVLAITVGIVLLGGLLTPVISDASTTEKTFTNEGFFRMTEISSDDEGTTTITWDYTTPYVFTINGVDVTLPFGNTSGNIFPYTIFATDGWGLRFTASNGGNNIDLNLYGSGSSSSLLWYATTTDQDTATITLNSGTASFQKNDSTVVTQSYTSVFLPDDKGEFTLKKGTEPAYMNKDSLIYSTGRTSATFGQNAFAININLSGNIENGATATILAPSGFTASEVTIASTEVDGYIDLYEFDKATFDITQDSTSITAGAVYSQVIVPYQVTAELSQHLDASEIGLLAVIPVLMIVAFLVFAVRIFAGNRD